MEDQVKQIISSILGVTEDQINEGFDMDSADSWDSLKHMELIGGIESGFGLTLDFDEIVQMRSYKGILQVLSTKLPDR